MAEIRHIFGKNNGNMAEAGAVGWMFDRKGELQFSAEAVSEDRAMEIGIEAGAEDVLSEDGTVTVRTAPGDLMAVRQAFVDAGLEPDEAELIMVPQNYIDVDADTARKILKLIDALEDNEDVQKVFFNAEFPDEVLEDM